MTERTSLTLTDDRRRLEDRLRALIDDRNPDALPTTQFRTTLYDMALTHLYESIQAFEEYEGDPTKAKAFSTSVVRPHYRTSLELKRP